MSFHKNISFSEGDAFTLEDAQKLKQNDLWLYEHLLQIKARPYRRNTKTEGLKIASGQLHFNPGKAHTRTRDVSFGNYFSTGCRPIVIATPGHSHGLDPSIMASVTGLRSNLPDSSGFRVAISRPTEKKKAGFAKGTYVHWVAIGW